MKKTYKIRQQLGYIPDAHSYEKVTDKVSLTVPDQTMSLRELMDRSQRTPASDDLFLGDDPELNDLADLPSKELTDQMDHVLASRASVAGLRDKAKRDNEAKRKADQEKIDKHDADEKKRLDEAKNTPPTQKPGADAP